MEACPLPLCPTGRLDHPGQPHRDPQAASPAAGQLVPGPLLPRQPLPGPGQAPQPGEAARGAGRHPQAAAPVPAGPAALAAQVGPAAAGAGGPGELAAGARAGVPVAGGAAAPEPRGAGPAAAGVPAEPGAAEGGPAPGGEGEGQDARPAEPAGRLEAQPAEQPSRGLLSRKPGGTDGSSVLAQAAWRAAAQGQAHSPSCLFASCGSAHESYSICRSLELSQTVHTRLDLKYGHVKGLGPVGSWAHCRLRRPYPRE